MKRSIRRSVTAATVATAAGFGGLLLAGTGHGSASTPGHTARPPVSGCAAAPAPCGTSNLNELVIHAANQAAQRSIEQQTTGTTTTNGTP